MTSQRAGVRLPDLEVSPVANDSATASLESGVRDSLAVAVGLAAAASIFSDVSCAQPTKCPVVVEAPVQINDVRVGNTSELSTGDSERVQTVVTSNHSDDTMNASEPRGRFCRIFDRLTVHGRKLTSDRRRRQSKVVQCCRGSTERGRRVVIESSLSADRSSRGRSRRCQTSYSDTDVEHDGTPIQQLTTSLTATDVRDGRFTARLPVDVMPSGDVMIRMRNGCLEMLQTEQASHQRCSRMCAVVNLPMYVDADGATVRYDPLQRCLIIEAATKGCHGMRRRSLSLDDLWWPPRGRKVAHELGVRLASSWRRRQQDDVVLLCTETKVVSGYAE